MSGGNIHCGAYEASDKSGSAFDGVFREIRNSIIDIATELDQLTRHPLDYLDGLPVDYLDIYSNARSE
jgi:hypothetical protein